VKIDLSYPTLVPTTTPVPIATPPVTITPPPAATLPPTPFTPIPTQIPQITAEISCAPLDLEVGQHISASDSYTETQWSASGLMSCRIERNSCAYHRLVGILDPTIVFKREEESPYYTEDILLHPAMIQPLIRLSQLVQEEWAGEFRLRVTDAYDSLLEHDLNQPDQTRKYSLHFEGRAIDLTTWPIDRSRYGRLCALAHCAGFDWVDNEDTHCHASINAKSLCFQCDE
jgi:hypothetical protein